MRGTTRDQRRVADIEAAGAEAVAADPDRVGSLMYALDGVTLVCWLLGSATGPADAVAALHGPRLEMLFARLVDTTVRGVVYEAAGTVDPAALANGREVAERARATWEIPVGFLEADPAAPGHWLPAAHGVVEHLLTHDVPIEKDV